MGEDDNEISKAELKSIVKKLSSGEIPAVKNQNEIDTAIIQKAINKHNENCPYRKEKETWFNSQMLKVIGVTCAFLSPWFIWATVSIFNLNGDVALVKQKQDAIAEINTELKEIRKEINAIKVDLAYIKRNP